MLVKDYEFRVDRDQPLVLTVPVLPLAPSPTENLPGIRADFAQIRDSFGVDHDR